MNRLFHALIWLFLLPGEWVEQARRAEEGQPRARADVRELSVLVWCRLYRLDDLDVHTANCRLSFAKPAAKVVGNSSARPRVD